MLDLPRPLAGTAELQGQVAIVTGGSSGIARRLGQSGATVVLADLSLMAAEKAAQVLEGEGIRTFPWSSMPPMKLRWKLASRRWPCALGELISW